MRPLWPLHFEDLSLDRAQIPLDVDEARYKWIESQGGLHLCTIRADSKLVGYFILTLIPHLHYKSAGLMAYTDVYYILPEFRKGGAGVRLIKFVERTLKLRRVSHPVYGEDLRVVKMYLSCKLKQDHTEVFEALGFRATDKVFTKLL